MTTAEGQGAEPLQFDKAEFGAAAGARACAGCKRTITDTYFEVRGVLLCPTCAEALSAKGGARSAFLRAFAFGGGVAIAGSIVWYAIIKSTNMEIGLIAVFVGLAVGMAVRKGARGRGGWPYQVLAMFLTYASITTSYVPFVLQGLRAGIEKSAKQEADKKADKGEQAKQADGANAPVGSAAGAPATVAAASDPVPVSPPKSKMPAVVALALLVAIVLGLALASPFLAGASNIIGLLIIAIALYEAWKLNRRVPVNGPFRIAAAPVPASPGTP